MVKDRVLFVCVHDSARGQMAQAYLRKMAGDRFEVQSAGLDPAPVNPLAVAVMAEQGLDLSRNKAQNVFDLYREGHLYTYVITLCTESEDRCPMFPGITKRLHWPFSDPSELEGDHEQKMAAARHIRDQIKREVQSFIAEHS
ncbi:MAG: arsenate reductase ArsC [Deltaproteobacteria bacterium]|nr:arsenate reductase ArsC [Deltaproteobacteria bacterium]